MAAAGVRGLMAETSAEYAPGPGLLDLCSVCPCVCMPM